MIGRVLRVAALAAAGPWDAVVDTSGYVPRNTLDVARALAPVAGRYVFMSTVSVYRDWPLKPLSERSEVLYCPPDAGPDYGTDTEDGPTRYGYQKSGCEAAAVAAFGADRATILRPGVVLGPREYVGRLPWWLRRVAAGGEMLAPGSPDRTIQPVDVRDLAAFALHTITEDSPRCIHHWAFMRFLWPMILVAMQSGASLLVASLPALGVLLSTADQ